MTSAFLAMSLLRGSIVLLLALAGAMLLRRHSAAVRRHVLAMGICGALLAPIVSIVVPAWQMPVPFRGEVTPRPRTPGAPAAAGTSAAVETMSTARAAATTPTSPMPTSDSRLSLTAVLIAAWLVGAAAGLARLVVGLARLVAVSRRSTPVREGSWAEELEALALSDPSLRRVRLLRSTHRSLLVAWGWLRPAIVLPADALTWSTARVRVVLEHEAEHVRRHDWPLQLAAEIVRSVAWFNPLAWLAANRLRLESERACDDAVLRRGADPADYARHLVALARMLTGVGGPMPAPAIARASNLERRITAMLDQHVSRTPVTRRARVVIGSVGLALTALVGTVAAQSQFASMSGVVRDQLGGTIPDVTLKLTNAATRASYEVKADRSGRFEFVGLVGGNYDLETWRAGFKTVHESMQLAGGQTATRDMRLELGTLEETIRIVDAVESAPRSAPDAAKLQAARRAAQDCSSEPNSGAITPPKKLRDVRAEYPGSLRGTGQSGRVVLWATIATDGTVRQVRTVEATTPEFEQSATDAVRQWQFSQTLLNCVPMEVEMKVTAAFDASGAARLEVGSRVLGDAALPAPPRP